MRNGRGLLFLILLGGAIIAGWLAFKPALREVRAEQRLVDDLPYVGMIAENAELLLADPPDDLPGAIGAMLATLFDGEGNLAAARVWDASGKLLCEVGSDDPGAPRKTTVLADLPAPKPPAPPTGDRRNTIYELQLFLAEQSSLSASMDAALQAGKGAGLHTELYAEQGNNLDLALNLAKELRKLRKRVPRLRDAVEDMDAALQALSHTDAEWLEKALSASRSAEAMLSLALEEQRAITDFPGPLPAALAGAAATPDLLPMRARRVTTPLFINTDDTLLAPAGTAEAIFYDRPAANALAAAHRVLADTRGWALPAALLIAALLTLLPRKRRR